MTSQNSSTPAVIVSNMNKSFDVVKGTVNVLKSIDLEIANGSFAVIYGSSGSGKSTLLHTILGLEKPTSGTVKVLGHDLYNKYDNDGLAEFRKEHIGMVYQQANWVKALDVVDNVAFPLALLGISYRERLEKAEEMLKAVGMSGWAQYHPAELSSGQQQRISLARALITNPEIVIADEPTGNLDFESGEELMDLLKRFAEETNKTIIMVTHDLEYLHYADTAIQLFDGEIRKIFDPSKDKDEMKVISDKRKKYEEYVD